MRDKENRGIGKLREACESDKSEMGLLVCHRISDLDRQYYRYIEK